VQQTVNKKTPSEPNARTNASCSHNAHIHTTTTTTTTTLRHIIIQASTRWNHIVAPLATEIKAMVDVVVDLIPEHIRTPLLANCDKHANTTFLDRFPKEYADEIVGIAEAIDAHECVVIIYNIAYELMGLCTSIIAQNEHGKPIHFRNLDFGLGSFNFTTMHWVLTKKLRPLLVNVRFEKSGALLYQATQYAGFVGLLTGVKKVPFYSLPVSFHCSSHQQAHTDLTTTTTQQCLNNRTRPPSRWPRAWTTTLTAT
jgi:acid ceramidase